MAKENAQHKTFLERAASDENKEDREFDEFVNGQRAEKENKEDSGVETITNEGDGSEKPEMLRTKPDPENKDSSGEEKGEGEEAAPKNPYWDRLDKLQKGKNQGGQENAQIAALTQQVAQLTELVKNQQTSGDSGGEEAPAKFTFREMEEGEDSADYIKEREKAMNEFVQKQAAAKRNEPKPESKDQPKENASGGLTAEDKQELEVLEASFKDKDEFLDALETNRITTGMLKHLNEVTDPEAVTKAIAADGKLARRISRLETSRERRMAILAVEHDIANGNLKAPPEEKGGRGIPNTRPAATKGSKKADEGSLAEEFGMISEHGVNHDNKVVRL